VEKQNYKAYWYLHKILESRLIDKQYVNEIVHNKSIFDILMKNFILNEYEILNIVSN